MTVIDEPLLATFRSAGRCEACGSFCRQREPHHILNRGAGRVDLPENLLALCRRCHDSIHYSARPPRGVLLGLAAARVGKTVEACVQAVHDARRGVR